MKDEDAPRGAGVSPSKEGNSERLAESLAAVLCDPQLELGTGDVLVVTEADGVLRETLEDGDLGALFERALGSDELAS